MALNHKFSNTSAMSILALFQNIEMLKVPQFQRNYSWDREKVDALWKDMLDNFELVRNKPQHVPEAEYLLGPVVLVQGDTREQFLVIDGQQRLATLTLLFCVCRDILSEYGEPDGLPKIKRFIYRTHMDKKIGYKLELNDTDKELFQEIQEYESTNESQYMRLKNRNYGSKSEKYLQENYLFLYDTIIHALDTNFAIDATKLNRNQKPDHSVNDEIRSLRKKNMYMLNYFLSYVVEYNFVVMIMVGDDTSAFQIFETLNERGQTLSKSNLIKNHILHQIDTNSNETQQKLSNRWNKIFDEIIEKQRDDEFIMESLRSRHFDVTPKISLKNLYKIIKVKIKTEENCIDYINKLEDDASFLATLNDPSLYSDIDTKDEIYAIKSLGAKFIRTPILAAYRRWGEREEYRTLVRLLVKFFFKYRVVRKEHPGSVEDLIINQVTKMIVNEKPLKEIIAIIKKQDDHDDFKYKFKKSFMTKPDKEVAKYVLQQFTIELGTQQKDVNALDNLALDYILPKKEFKNWNKQEFLDNGFESRLEEFALRLGNLTVLNKPMNKNLQESSFSKKKDAINNAQMEYSALELHINKDTVYNYDTWTASIISKREEKFLELANKIWNLDDF